MKGIRQQFGALGGGLLIVLLSGAAGAVPVTFTGAVTSFTRGAGYGVDALGTEVVPLTLPPAFNPGSPLNGGQGGTLLDVLFTAGGVPVSFTLPSVGSSASAVVGTVQLRELYIDAAEQDGLGVTADFTAVQPVAGLIHVTATGTAIVGPVPSFGNVAGFDPVGAVDLTIHWTPLDVSFGDGGLFRIEMGDLNFDGGPVFQTPQTFEQFATVTLLAAPAAAPEPVTLALVGLGLAGLGLSRRRRAR